MFTLEWEMLDSQTATEGGDTLEVETAELMIDAAITENHTLTSTPTSHAVENGSDITDHVRRELDAISIECAVSNAPAFVTSPNMSIGSESITLAKRPLMTSGAQVGQRSGTEEIGNTYNVRVLKSTLQFDRPMEVYDEIRNIMRRAIPVTIIGTRFGDFESMIITNMSIPVEAHTGIEFTLDFKEMRIVSTETVDAPSPQVERGRRRTNRGNQDAVPLTGALAGAGVGASTQRASVLAQAFGL